MICLMQMPIMRLLKANLYTKTATYALTLVGVVGSLVPPRHIEQLTFSFSDKSIHALYYFMLSVGWLHTYAQKNKIKQLYVVLALWLMGFLLECLQALLPINRMMDAYDLLANGLGILIGLLLARVGRNLI